MREIKFRGIDTETGEWVYGFLAASDQIMVWNEDNATGKMLQVIPETVGQFIGRHDKKRTEEYPKGQEIYQGDVIKYPNEIYKMFRAVGWEGKENGLELIVWAEKETAFMGKDLNSLKKGWRIEDIMPRYLYILDMTKHSEIIGNIHTHPELMEHK